MEDYLLAKAKREKAQLEVEELRGNLISIADVEQREINLAMKIRHNLDGLPYGIAAEVASLDSPAECEQCIRTAIERACGAIARKLPSTLTKSSSLVSESPSVSGPSVN